MANNQQEAEEHSDEEPREAPKRVFCTLTNNYISVRKTKILKDPEYPSKWFNDHPDELPKLTISFIKGATFNLMRGIVKKEITSNSLTVNNALPFMYFFCQEYLIGVLDKTYTSYGRRIGRRGASITPMSFVTLDRTESEVDGGDHVDGVKSDDKWMMFYILSIYRIVRITNETYRTQVINNIGAKYNSLLGGKAPSLAMINSNYSNWQTYDFYNMMVAAIDMFFIRFPTHLFSEFRLGSLPSRFRDCSIILSLSSTMEALGMNHIIDIAYWIYAENSALNFKNVYFKDEEFDMTNSYFPYQVDMKLTTKSPYSATVNPSLHLYLHAIGVFLSIPRSVNARLVSPTDIANTMTNAALVGFAFKKSSNLGARFHYTDPDEGAEDQAPLIEEKYAELDLTQPPPDQDPVRWFGYYEYKNFQDIPGLHEFILEVQTKIVAPRDGTIGKYVKEYAFV